MNPVDAIVACYRRYFDFSGRANRPEFWWFFALYALITLGARSFDGSVGFAFFIAQLVSVVPFIAAVVRRIRDTGLSGWFALTWLVPIIGMIFCARRTHPEPFTDAAS
jgi:uncharacterized membrane protein YhaH (DUF805 family)